MQIEHLALKVVCAELNDPFFSLACATSWVWQGTLSSNDEAFLRDVLVSKPLWDRITKARSGNLAELTALVILLLVRNCTYLVKQFLPILLKDERFQPRYNFIWACSYHDNVEALQILPEPQFWSTRSSCLDCCAPGSLSTGRHYPGSSSSLNRPPRVIPFNCINYLTRLTEEYPQAVPLITTFRERLAEENLNRLTRTSKDDPFSTESLLKSCSLYYLLTEFPRNVNECPARALLVGRQITSMRPARIPWKACSPSYLTKPVKDFIKEHNLRLLTEPQFKTLEKRVARERSRGPFQQVTVSRPKRQRGRPRK